jgi:hypothetical protein
MYVLNISKRIFKYQEICLVSKLQLIGNSGQYIIFNKLSVIVHYLYGYIEHDDGYFDHHPHNIIYLTWEECSIMLVFKYFEQVAYYWNLSLDINCTHTSQHCYDVISKRRYQI